MFTDLHSTENIRTVGPTKWTKVVVGLLSSRKLTERHVDIMPTTISICVWGAGEIFLVKFDLFILYYNQMV